MHRLGISVYPNHSKLKDNIEYIKMAAKYGFSRVFTCLLSVNGDKEEIIKEFKEIISVANKNNMKVIADVSPKIFSELNISYKDLSFFHELGAYGVRLDLGFTGNEESLMTFNPYGLKIEINMSNDTSYLDNIIKYKPNTENLLGCHNFYPHRYSGLEYNHFIKCCKNFKKYGITTAAFVNSPTATFGPWPVKEGLCTLEMHRTKTLKAQVKHLLNLGFIDDIIIANAFASEDELRIMNDINKSMIELDVELVDDIPDLERKIVIDENHFNRGDISEYMIRSTQSRVKYRNHTFEPFNTPDIKRGDVLIDTSLYGHYAGELQIALKDMENSGKTNVVGRIDEDEIFLLDSIEPWQKFCFKLKQADVSK
ncbi:DUF871 domain-containing protein [Clostridiaceae bacterium M8S5]|nr:DUF871 domain-containing protein [Clostridiaceae bacterium M8S5]